MWICDTHSDTLYAMGVQHAKELMITPQRLRQGGVTLQTFALWTGSKGNQGDVNGIVAAEMAAIPALLAAGMRQVDDPAQAQEGESSFMLSIEGGEVFESGLETVAQWREKACAWLPCFGTTKTPWGTAPSPAPPKGSRPMDCRWYGKCSACTWRWIPPT